MERYVYYVGIINGQDVDLFNKMIDIFPALEVADWEEINYHNDKVASDWRVRVRQDTTKDNRFYPFVDGWDLHLEIEEEEE